jgi:hypothetical protein
LFGFVLSGLPVKKPGAQVTVTDELVPPISVEDIAAPRVLDPRLIEALKRNAAIDPSKEPCTHPLAVWEMHFMEEPRHHSRVNYVKVGQEKAVDDFVDEMLANGNIEPAPLDSKLCFALLVVDKRDYLGKVSGSRVCIDLKAINKVMMPDLYPLPTLQEALSKAVRCKGPKSYRFKIDGTQSYHRFEMKQKIICFKWRGKMYVEISVQTRMRMNFIYENPIYTL